MVAAPVSDVDISRIILFYPRNIGKVDFNKINEVG